MAVDQTAFQSPGTGLGERCDTWTTVWGPFGLNSYTTLVTTDEPSTTIGHSKENFLGPSIHVMVPPPVRTARCLRTRRSSGHPRERPGPTRPRAVPDPSGPRTPLRGSRPRSPSRSPGRPAVPPWGPPPPSPKSVPRACQAPPPNVGGLHNPDEASRGLETRLARCARPRSASQRVLASGADEATVLLALEARAVEEPLPDRRMVAVAHRGDHVPAIVAQMLDGLLPRDVPLIGHQDHEDQDERADDQPDHPTLEAPFVLEGHVGPGDRHGGPDAAFPFK